MKPTIQLINALRKAADRIANGSDYHWNYTDKCNCGILAAECGATREEIILGVRGPWSDSAARCRSTGERLPVVFAKLTNAGLDLADIGDIEFLDNPEVMARLGWEAQGRTLGFWSELRCSTSDEVARYFCAQADILEEALGEQFETRPIELTARQPLVESTRELVR